LRKPIFGKAILKFSYWAYPVEEFQIILWVLKIPLLFTFIKPFKYYYRPFEKTDIWQSHFEILILGIPSRGISNYLVGFENSFVFYFYQTF